MAAGKLQQALLGYKITSFVAHTDIEPMREWENEIISALNISDGVVALLHKGFHESMWTDQEIGIGVGKGLLVIPVSFGESPYGFMGRFQALPGMGKSYDLLAVELHRILLTHRLTRRRMAEVLLDQFVDSANFDQAKRNMQALETVEFWEDGFSKEARKAVKENLQLANAWDIPELLEGHIRRWQSKNIPF